MVVSLDDLFKLIVTQPPPKVQVLQDHIVCAQGLPTLDVTALQAAVRFGTPWIKKRMDM